MIVNHLHVRQGVRQHHDATQKHLSTLCVFPEPQNDGEQTDKQTAQCHPTNTLVP